MKERIAKITERWFLSEEPLFSVFCTHRVVENRDMKCCARVGKGLVEVNPVLCEDLSDRELEERLRVEVIRILLKHPYDRQPDGCSTTARALGSNCVITDSYYLHHIEMDNPQDFQLPSHQHFEYYARRIQQLLPQSQWGQDGEPDENSDIAANWQQDELMAAQVNEVIRNVKAWGSMPGGLVEQIIASTKARVDYRKILAGFRASILSEKRKLTRMRPNRRFGFDAMGSRYDFTTRMIIGVDCSGSISKDDLRNFYSTINRFFQYGIKQIDVVQFDTELGDVQTLLKASRNIKVTGRGGTSFQPFIDFVARHPEYDGALIYTDGYAAKPKIPAGMRTPLCWVLRSEKELKKHEEWMRQSGRVCVIEKPH
jgi:predicted metal-dependent peptidase